MTLTQLRYLVAIADSGLNITLAAARVHATQPGLSKRLKQLEDELGFQLFVRKGKSLDAVTHAGQHVLERARIILAETANIRAIAANLRNEARGELRIATTHTQARFALPAAIGALSRSYPQVSVHLQPGRDGEVLAQLEAGRVDLAVISTAGAPPPAGIALPAYRWQRVIVAPQGHPLATRRQPPTLDELAALPLVSYDSSLKPDSSLRRAFEAVDLHPQIVMTAGDADLIKTYVRAGLGIGVLAEMAMLDSDTDLCALPADHLFPQCTTWIVLRRESVLREYVLEFIAQFAPHLDRRDVVRALAADAAATEWPAVPHWRERPPSTPPDAA
ncbi:MULTISPECIES: LysR substrate-binding domain-containing protein [Rhodanobacter]|uniref:LysR substrate-binding domain-containing protein n=3 Tax=Rhodanobacteraceae TaxID=1775411 RepID=UPI000923E0D5|nr:LysR substrate-binding domain-containing protein [Rhodanobacter thiooxydans]TAN15587.1 MAG: LysR family transcriptional regulator [Rhodanobacter sp.]UJJ56540.1 LysR substrate-binding domain-containing protein [Rhodanobacter thiooxydans]